MMQTKTDEPKDVPYQGTERRRDYIAFTDEEGARPYSDGVPRRRHERDRFELARDEIGLAREDARERAERASEFALFALRSVFLLNGGAILALITILSAPNIHADEKQAMQSAGFFSFGLIFTIAAAGVFFVEAQAQSVAHREKASKTASLAQGIDYPRTQTDVLRSQAIRVGAFFIVIIATFFFAFGLKTLESSLDDAPSIHEGKGASKATLATAKEEGSAEFAKGMSEAEESGSEAERLPSKGNGRSGKDK